MAAPKLAHSPGGCCCKGCTKYSDCATIASPPPATISVTIPSGFTSFCPGVNCNNKMAGTFILNRFGGGTGDSLYIYYTYQGTLGNYYSTAFGGGCRSYSGSFTIDVYLGCCTTDNVLFDGCGESNDGKCFASVQLHADGDKRWIWTASWPMEKKSSITLQFDAALSVVGNPIAGCDMLCSPTGVLCDASTLGDVTMTF